MADDKLIKPTGLGLVTSTFFLAGTMAGSGVLALPHAMVGAGRNLRGHNPATPHAIVGAHRNLRCASPAILYGRGR